MLPPVVAVLAADITPFTAGLAAVRGEMDVTAEESSAKFLGIEGAARAAGLAVAAIGGAAVVGGLIAVTKEAAQFQQEMELVHTQAGASQDEVDRMSNSILQMAGALGSTPEQLAASLYHVESAGFRSTQALQMVQAAAELAKVGNADFDSTTQAVIASMAAYADQGMTAAQAIAILNATVGSGDMRMQGFATSMGSGILASARTFGLSLKDVGAAMATLTDNATPPEEAATRLRMTFSMMGAPSQAAVKAFNAIGLNATSLADDMRKPDGLLVAVQDLQAHLSQIDTSQLQGGLDEAKADMEKFGFTTDQINQMVSKLGPTATEQAVILARAFGGGRTSGAILTLLSESDRLKQKYADITAQAANFEDDWTKTTQTVAFDWSGFVAEIEADGTRVGNVVLPEVGAALRDLTGFIHDAASAADQLPAHLAPIETAASTIVDLFTKSDTTPDLVHQTQAPVHGLLSGDERPVGPISQSTQMLLAGHVLGEGLMNGVRDALTAGGGLAKTVATAVASLDWDAIGQDAGNAAFPFFVGFMNTLFSGVVAEIQRHPVESIAAVLAVAFAPERLLGPALDAIKGIPIAGPIFDALFGNLLRGINKAGGPGRDLIANLVATVFEGFGQGLMREDGAVLVATRAMLQGAVHTLEDFQTSAYVYADDAAKAFGRGIGSGFDREVLGPLRGIVRDADTILGYLIGRAGEIGGDAMRAFGTEVDAVWEAWGGHNLPVLVDEFQGFFRGLPNWMLDQGGMVLDGLREGVEERIPALYARLDSFINDLEAPFVGLYSILYEAGASAMQGLLDGLSGGAWSDVQGFVTQIAGWIAAHKGPIERDRELLQPHGEAFMEGLHHGLTRGFDQVQGLVQGMAQRVSDAASIQADRLPVTGVAAGGRGGASRSSAGSAPAVAGTAPVINITINGVSNPILAGVEVQNRLAKLLAT
jgi:TP901 family phage tail tape measure protein